MPYLDTTGARVYYELEGEDTAPCLTLLNGHSRSSSDFRAMSKFMVGKGFRVLRPDNRGSGKTEIESAFKVDDMLADVVALWDANGIATSHVLGISYGGVLAQLLTHRHPNRVQSLILASSTPSSFFMGVDNHLAGQDPETLEKTLSKYFSPHFAEKNPALFKGMIKETAKVFLDPASRERATLQRQALTKFDFTPLLHSIRVPTLILHGEDDEVISPEAADVLHRAIAQSKLKLFPHVGHLFLAESPTLFYEAVLEFLTVPA